MPKEAPKKLEKDDRKEDNNIILKVDMHCQGCKEKVRKSLTGIQGLEKIDIDMNAQRVTVKGKVDAKTLLETVRKKSGRRTELVFPAQLSQEGGRGNKEEKKTEEDVAIDSIIKTIDSITALFLNQRDVTVVLRVKMHCGGCAKQVQKALQKMEGVYDVKVDFEGEKVTVKGKNIDPMEVCERVRKKTGKHAALISSQKKEETKQQEKKEGESEKKESKKGNTEKKENQKGVEGNSQKKEEKQKEKKKVEEKEKQEDSQKKEEKEEKVEVKKVEGQEKSTEKAEDEKKEEGKGEEENRKREVKKSQHIPAMAVPEYVYPPQLFSDENPNACIIM